MKRIVLSLVALAVAMLASAQSTVYFIEEISPESLVKIFDALGVEPKGRVCVKISTGEGGNNHYLKPPLSGRSSRRLTAP